MLFFAHLLSMHVWDKSGLSRHRLGAFACIDMEKSETWQQEFLDSFSSAIRPPSRNCAEVYRHGAKRGQDWWKNLLQAPVMTVF
jgi:hypothetical protein